MGLSLDFALSPAPRSRHEVCSTPPALVSPARSLRAPSGRRAKSKLHHPAHSCRRSTRAIPEAPRCDNRCSHHMLAHAENPTGPLRLPVRGRHLALSRLSPGMGRIPGVPLSSHGHGPIPQNAEYTLAPYTFNRCEARRRQPVRPLPRPPRQSPRETRRAARSPAPSHRRSRIGSRSGSIPRRLRRRGSL